MTITMTREVLAEKLQERLAAAKAEDARAAKVHKMAEMKALVMFRAELREAMKWDYEKVKKKYFRASIGDELKPSCPRLEATSIATVIKQLNYDTRKAPFNISPGSDLYAALMWVPESERPAKSVCG